MRELMLGLREKTLDMRELILVLCKRANHCSKDTNFIQGSSEGSNSSSDPKSKILQALGPRELTLGLRELTLVLILQKEANSSSNTTQELTLALYEETNPRPEVANFI